jgi:colicin import membrane protein
VTALGQRIEGLDMLRWAALTKRTAERAVAAAEKVGRRPSARLTALAKMSEAELIETCRKNTWRPQRRPPTLHEKLVEAELMRAMAEQRAQVAEQDRKDALADAVAARAEAQQSAAAADDARERARTTTEELLRKELQRAAEQRENMAQFDSLRNQVAQARAFGTAARAEARESAAAAEAAREREAVALDKYARQGAQLAGAQRKVETALHKSQAAEEKMRGELDQLRADTAAEIAAAVQRASAADQRAEERLAERAADRREAQAVEERLRGEIVKIRSDAETEVAAAQQRTKAAENRALQRMAERASDRMAARETIEKLQALFEECRANAQDEVHTAREQAVLAIATAKDGTDRILAKVRADAKRQIEEAMAARAHAEAIADSYRAQIQNSRAPVAGGLIIPIPGWTLRPATRHIEMPLTALSQINYILEVGMAEEISAETPLDPQLVERLTRSVQRQAEQLREELVELPTRFSAGTQQAEDAAEYTRAAAGACRAILRRIRSVADQLGHRSTSPDAEALDAVRRMLTDPKVEALIAEPAND